MKFISVILAVIILGLGFTPCADSVVTKQSDQIISNSSPTSENHNHSDYCSPLCVCSCCGTVIAQLEDEAVFDVQLSEINSTQILIFIQNLPADIYYPIWEPPKIV